MSLDILLKNAPKNWSRGASLDASVSGASTGGKIALGGMVLGTFLGLALITSPGGQTYASPITIRIGPGRGCPSPAM